MLIIYTDGSSIGNPGPGGRGVLIKKNISLGIPLDISLSGGEQWTTNNRMELLALIKALMWVIDEGSAHHHICIYMDSKYVHDAIETYLSQRIARGRRLANKKPVLNKDLREQVPALISQIPNLSWKRVKAHAVDKDNNLVDVIARRHALKLQKELPYDFVPPSKILDKYQPNLFS